MKAAKRCTSCKDGLIVKTLFGSQAVGDKCESCEGTGWDTRWTDEICCPFCGHEHSESYELRSDEDTIDCESCGKAFQYQRHITVDYTTFVGPDCIRDEGLHAWVRNPHYEPRDGKSYGRCSQCHKYAWKEMP